MAAKMPRTQRPATMKRVLDTMKAVLNDAVLSMTRAMTVQDAKHAPYLIHLA